MDRDDKKKFFSVKRVVAQWIGWKNRRLRHQKISHFTCFVPSIAASFFLVFTGWLQFSQRWIAKKRKVANWKIARSKLFDRKLLNGKRVKMANCLTWHQLIIRPRISSVYRGMFTSWQRFASVGIKTLTFVHCQDKKFQRLFSSVGNDEGEEEGK